jgi:uncharacterized membrane protein YdbT with pleckstrin-like domain
VSYIDKNLLPDETIVFRTKKHTMIFFVPVLCLIAAYFVTVYMQQNPVLVKVIWMPWVLALIFWAQVGLSYFASDYAVTNKRVMMREGFFVRHATELRLNTISQVHVNQSLLGQVLNYGEVAINAFGASDSFTMVSHPYDFQKCINEQLEKSS